jgi:branched-chain amino acid transport system ATP-binding protein
MNALVVDNIRAGYGDRVVLDGLSLRVEAAERICLIGHNGAGKSTILRAVTGQIRLKGGAVSYGEKRIDGTPTESLVRLGIVLVPAGRRVFKALTVRQNLEIGAFTRAERDGVAADIESFFERFEVLRRKQSTRAGVLSGGEQQMLAIARGLMARPSLLLVDEPSLGLSPIMVDEVFAFLGALAADSIAVVLAEQNVRKALSVTDRAIVLSQGAVVSQLPSAELMANEDFRRTYLGAA